MPRLSRRSFLHALAAASSLGGAGLWATHATAGARIVILGAGPAGLAAAQALTQHDPQSAVTLVERDPTRFRPTGGHALADLRPVVTDGLASLRAVGCEVVLDDAQGVDWNAGRLELFSGRHLAFDRLLLAPGTAPVDEGIDGLDARARHHWPAAWGQAAEARRLRAQLSALEARAHVVLRLPDPVSHSHVAVARASTLARICAEKGARLTVVDAGTRPVLRERVLGQLRAEGRPSDLAWHLGPDGGTVLSVDASAHTLDTNAGQLTADVVNFVPRQGAGHIARAAGLTGPDHWCAVDALGRSHLRPDAFVLGDARAHAVRNLDASRSSGWRGALSGVAEERHSRT